MTEEAPAITLEEPPKMRQLVIETDGTKVNLAKVEVNPLEARAIFEMLLKQLGG